MVADEFASLAFIENWNTAFLVGLPLSQDMIDQHQKVVSDCDHGSLLALSCESPELAIDVAILFRDCSPGTLRQHAVQPSISSICSAPMILAGAAAISGT